MVNRPVISTLGHSSMDEEALLRLLSAHRLEAVADVRSIPASGRHPQFNKRRLKPFLQAAGIDYLWLGRELGGLREETTYEEYMLTAAFAQGLVRRNWRVIHVTGEDRTEEHSLQESLF